MAVKKIYIVRHGQTKFNEQGVVQGRGIDASLNELGRRQAEQFYQQYKETGFQRILISSLKRTYESVEKFINDGIPFDVHEGLDEISWGVHEGAAASELRNQYFREMVRSWRSGETDFKIEGGESPEEVAERQMPVIEAIKGLAEEMILVCMHGRALRILLCNILGLPLSEMDQFEHDNLGLYVVEYNRHGFEVVKENSTEHFI